MNVLVFGAGAMGRQYYEWSKNSWMSILAFVDNNEKNTGGYIGDIPIISPQNIAHFTFDKIIIAVGTHSNRSEIFEQLLASGVCKEKIEVLSYPKFYSSIKNADRRIQWVRDFAKYVYENNLAGSVAECGVYRGGFAKWINRYFYDRKLYLFDTFDGFNKSDFEVELDLGQKSFINGVFGQNPDIFENGDIEVVMSGMPCPDNCIIKKGYFPDTAIDIEDIFCFVNLDMDLYQPMLSALKFFWGKMTDGGVILLHDYFHPELPGVAQAVIDFEKHIEKHINKVSIGDGCSIALIRNHEL